VMYRKEEEKIVIWEIKYKERYWGWEKK
jgi:hypothetical protein